MKLIRKLFPGKNAGRDEIISSTSLLGIIANILIAASKVIIGLIASSIAIVSEGVNNAADALTSVLTLVGAKLAKMHPDSKHPFGYGRIEYLSGLVIAILIFVTGFEMLTSSVRLIFHPEPLAISYLSLIIVAASAAIKFFLGVYTMKMGKKANSSSLTGVGADCRNDAFASIITIVAALVFLIFDFSIDAYAGIIISLLILKAGFDVLKDTVGDLLGRPGEKELAVELYGLIKSTPGILGVADMMLHNYGPDAWSGSVNVEIDESKTVGEIYEFLHELQLRIMHEYKVTMVFGVYAVDNDHENVKELRSRVLDFIKTEEHIKSFHAVYIDKKSDTIYCDFIVDYALRDWDAVREKFATYMNGFYPGKKLELTIETEFV